MEKSNRTDPLINMLETSILLQTQYYSFCFILSCSYDIVHFRQLTGIFCFFQKLHFPFEQIRFHSYNILCIQILNNFKQTISKTSKDQPVKFQANSSTIYFSRQTLFYGNIFFKTFKNSNTQELLIDLINFLNYYSFLNACLLLNKMAHLE